MATKVNYAERLAELLERIPRRDLYELHVLEQVLAAPAELRDLLYRQAMEHAPPPDRRG